MLFLFLAPKPKVLPASKTQARDWWARCHLGFHEVPVKQISQPSGSRTRPLHPEQVMDLVHMIKDDETINSDIYVVIRDLAEWKKLTEDEDYDPTPALHDPKVIKEVIAGSHSVESMKYVLNEPDGQEQYGWLVEEPSCRIFVSPEDDTTESVLLYLGGRDNRQREQQLKSTFRDHLFLMRQYRDTTKNKKTGQLNHKETVQRFCDTTGLAKGTAEQYWQFVSNEMEYVYVDAILADAEEYYGVRGAGRRVRGRPKLVQEVKGTKKPPPKITGNSGFLPLLQLTPEDRLEMLSRIYKREIDETQMSTLCKTIAQKTYVFNSILLATKEWLKSNRPDETAATDWDDFLKQFPKLHDQGWFASLCSKYQTRRTAPGQVKFLDSIKRDVAWRLEEQFKVREVI